jgi:hypothetical protein
VSSAVGGEVLSRRLAFLGCHLLSLKGIRWLVGST